MKDEGTRFTGSVPEIYHRHLGPLLFEPYARDLARRLAPFARPGLRVLEIAAGTGILTRHLVTALPGAALCATDLAEPMLEIAQRHVGPREGIEWRPADAVSLPFPDESFDLVTCQFGVMFFPDKDAAAREVRRSLRPGGRFVLNVWDSLEANPLGRIPHETIGSFFPADPPGFYRIPFGYHDPAAARDLLERAGFANVRTEHVPLVAEAPTAEHAAIGLVQGSPVLSAILERGGVAPETIVAAVAAALAREHGDRPLRATMKAWVVSAERPV